MSASAVSRCSIGSGRFVGYRGTGRDVTAEVFAEAELRQAKDHAEAASRDQVGIPRHDEP